MVTQARTPPTVHAPVDRSPSAPAAEDAQAAEDAHFCEGGCACGAVRYRVTSKPLIVHACHCRLCQRQTGASNAVNALIEADRVIVQSGEIEEILLDTPSGRGQRIARCVACRVPIWSNYLASNQGRHMRFLRVGTLDDPELMPPDVHIYTGSKLSWYVIPDGVPSVEPFYDLKMTWSKDSRRRLRDLSERSKAAYACGPSRT